MDGLKKSKKDMEGQVTLTRTELIEVFKRWNRDHLEKYPDAKITDPEAEAPGQADELLRILKEVQS